MQINIKLVLNFNSWIQIKRTSIQKEFNNLLNEKRKALVATQMQKRKPEAIKSSNKVK